MARGAGNLSDRVRGRSRRVTKAFSRAAASGELPEFSGVIASEAKQSISPRVLNHGLLRFARNDRVRLEAVTYGRLLTLRTQARTSASTSGSAALTSCTVMPALIRGS
jgi:hypothetical protein